MNIGVLGTGMVGQALGSKLVELGHVVTMGSRTSGNKKAVEWAMTAGYGASEGTFAEAAAFGELIVNATNGNSALAALTAAGEKNLENKPVLDLTNPLGFDENGVTALTVANTDSLGEQLQRAFPTAHIVKTLNTVNSALMVNPSLLPQGHNVFVNGDNEHAKARAIGLLQEMGWPAASIVDLGGIAASRSVEAFMHLWISLWKNYGSADFNIAIVRP